MSSLLRLRKLPTGRALQQASNHHHAMGGSLHGRTSLPMCGRPVHMPTRSFASNDGFLSGLKKIFNEEVEANSELKATLEKLKGKKKGTAAATEEDAKEKDTEEGETIDGEKAKEGDSRTQQLKEEAQKLRERAEGLKEGADYMFNKAKEENAYLKAGAGMFDQFRGRFAKKGDDDTPPSGHAGGDGGTAGEGTEGGAEHHAGERKAGLLGGFKSNLKEAYAGLWESESKSSIALKTHLGDDLAPTEDKAKKQSRTFDPEAPAAMVQVEPDATTWQKLQKRLREAPLIQEILSGAKVASESGVGQAVGGTIKGAKDRVSDAREDVSEYWETSQNPWVYRVSSIYDGMFGETEEAIAVGELRRLDPSFNLYDWKDKIGQTVVPEIVNETYTGRFDKVDAWCAEALQARFKNLVNARKEAGLINDSHLIDTDDFNVLHITAEHRGAPVIILQCMTQVLHCIRNRDGEILEGGEEDVRAVYYVVAFQRNYNPDDQSLEWKVVDFQEAGSMGYI